MPLDEQMSILAKLMDVSTMRAQVHAGNIANQNTPGYKTRAVAFDQAFQAAMAGDSGEDAETVQPTVYEPHATPVQVDGNDVALADEIMGAAKNSTMYDAYIAMAKGKLRLLGIAAGQAPGG